MFSALLSFLGGSVFRTLWAEASSYLNKRQDHAHEIQRMEIQARLDDAAHARNIESIRLQAELGVKMVEVERETAIAQGDADAFTAAMKNAWKPSGIKFIDAWNGGIRPWFATIAGLLWIAKLYGQNWRMDEFDVSLVAVIVGFFFADRSLRRNGK